MEHSSARRGNYRRRVPARKAVVINSSRSQVGTRPFAAALTCVIPADRGPSASIMDVADS